MSSKPQQRAAALLPLLCTLSSVALALPECNFGVLGDEGCAIDGTPTILTLAPTTPPLEMQLNPARPEQSIELLVDARAFTATGRDDYFRMFEFVLHDKTILADVIVAVEFTRNGNFGSPTRVRVVRELVGKGLEDAPVLVTHLPPTPTCLRIAGGWTQAAPNSGHLRLSAAPSSCEKRGESAPLAPVLDVDVPGVPQLLRLGALKYTGSMSPAVAPGTGRLVHYLPLLSNNPQP